MLGRICMGASALALLSGSSLADGFEQPARVRAAQPVHIVREVIHRPVLHLVPTCIEIQAVLLRCSLRGTLYPPYGPDVRILQSSLVMKQRTPYPKLSSWPRYY
jgi:hypothetical protein